MEQKDVIKRLSDYIEYDALTNPSDFAKSANVDVSGFSKMLKGQTHASTTSPDAR